MEKKNKLRLWLRHRHSENGEALRLDYTRSRNQLRNLTRSLKRDHEKGIASRAKTNPKAFWQYTRSRTTIRSGIAPLFNDSLENKPLVFDDEGKAEILQSQFCSVQTNEPEEDIPRLNAKPVAAEMIPVKITKDAILKKLSQLDINKSAGPDGIHPRVLKECANELAAPLADLFQASIDSGYVPDDWKFAIVSPIFKKGSKQIAANYRPIALTSVLCKLLESFIREAMVEFLLKNSFLTSTQYGFVKGRSTTLQLLSYIDQVCESLLLGNCVDAIYFDFQKAFDTVPYKRLLGKMASYGISSQIHK